MYEYLLYFYIRPANQKLFQRIKSAIVLPRFAMPKFLNDPTR